MRIWNCFRYSWMLLCMGCIPFFSDAQEVIDQRVFRNPLDGVLDISGTFCEIRSNHFHAGIDIRTGGVEGKPVYAVGDGYVSRIQISAYGYGKALYINHPNGFTSVYAHLQIFNKNLHEYLRQKQYELKSWEIDIIPEPGEIPVKKGEVIALSGNTGSSQGPHLHFEIRKTRNNQFVNPLLFGFNYKDSSPPQFKKLRLYYSNDSNLHGRKHIDYMVKKDASGNYVLASNSKPEISGFMGIGVEVQDFQDLSGFRNDIYWMKVQAAGQLIYHIRFDSLPYEFGRFSNAHADYWEYMVNTLRIHRAFRLPNLPLDNYLHLVNNGILHVNERKTVPVRIEIADFKNNRAILEFSVNLSPATGKPDHTHRHLSWSNAHFLSIYGISIKLEEGTLYEDVDLEFKSYDTLNRYSLPYVQIGNNTMPVQKEFEVEFELPGLKKEWQNKLVLVWFNAKNQPKTYELKLQNERYFTRVKELGLFTIWPDLKAPVITPLNLKDSSTVSLQSTLKVKIADDLSGIRSFKAYLDNEWFLMEYEYKENMLFHLPENRITPGWHAFALIVEDYVGNTTEYTANLLFE